jgi:NAD+ synthase
LKFELDLNFDICLPAGEAGTFDIMKTNLSINPSQTSKQIELFIRDALTNAGFKNVVVGLSGGIDSAVSCSLAVRALGTASVFPAVLPCGKLNRESEKDALIFTDKSGIPKNNVTHIDIETIVNQIIKSDADMDNIRRGNVMARVRMTFLYDLSKKYNALVLGTENKTEFLLGYFTRFGDDASDIEPIRNLYKTQVRQLAEYLGVPEKIINKAPTAQLYNGQTDEGEFGFTYEEGDQILYLVIEKKIKTEEIIKKGFSGDLVYKVQKRMEENKFKHRLPYHI